MKKNNIPLDLQTINAAVAGETWTVEKVVKCYSGEIDCLCTKMEKQPDGSVRKLLRMMNL